MGECSVILKTLCGSEQRVTIKGSLRTIVISIAASHDAIKRSIEEDPGGPMPVNMRQFVFWRYEDGVPVFIEKAEEQK